MTQLTHLFSNKKKILSKNKKHKKAQKETREAQSNITLPNTLTQNKTLNDTTRKIKETKKVKICMR